MRSIKPAKLDTRLDKIYRGWDGEDLAASCFGMFMIFGTATALLWVVSLWCIFIILPVIVWMIGCILYAKNSVVFYGHTLYEDAIKSYQKLIDQEAKNQAKELLNNVYTHQLSFEKLSKGHGYRADCKDCSDRVKLIDKLYVAQTIPYLDRSDIESVESNLAARKELGL